MFYNEDKKWDRLYTAMMIPYKDGTFEIDYEGFRKVVRFFLTPKFIEEGNGGLIVNPEAGEIFYLTDEEKQRLLEITLEEAKGKLPVFCGICSLRTEGYARDSAAAKAAGADGLFFCPPMGSGDITYAWNSVKYPEIWIDILKAMVDASDLPIIVHPTTNPSIYGVGLPIEPALEICKSIPNVVGWKMTYSYQGWQLIAKAFRTQLDHHVGILGAPTDLWHTALMNNNFDGSVNGLLTAEYEKHVDLVYKWKTGDYEGALKVLHNGLLEFSQYIYEDYSRLHIRYKIAAWLTGVVNAPFMRPPQPTPRKLEVENVAKLLRSMGTAVISQNKIDNVLVQLTR